MPLALTTVDETFESGARVLSEEDCVWHEDSLWTDGFEIFWAGTETNFFFTFGWTFPPLFGGSFVFFARETGWTFLIGGFFIGTGSERSRNGSCIVEECPHSTQQTVLEIWPPKAESTNMGPCFGGMSSSSEAFFRFLTINSSLESPSSKQRSNSWLSCCWYPLNWGALEQTDPKKDFGLIAFLKLASAFRSVNSFFKAIDKGPRDASSFKK